MSVKITEQPHNEWEVVNYGESPYTIYNVHAQRACDGRPCVLHNPTKHPWSGQPLHWDTEQALFYRLCLHGQEVLDPDQYDYIGRDHLEIRCCGFVRKGGPRITCLNCNDVIQSKHRHDFVSCKCGATSVDGGPAYTRILGSQWGFFSDGAT